MRAKSRRFPTSLRRYSLAALLIALLSGCANGPGHRMDTTQPSPMGSASLTDKIQAIAADALASGKTPSLAIAIVRDGKIVLAAGFGSPYPDRSLHANVDTPYAIGSVTKQFTAASLLLLVQQHKLSLDVKLAKFFPQFAGAQTITLRQMLHHMSGLHNYPYLTEHPWPRAGIINPATILAILQKDKLDFPPGQKFAYSNTNYTLLAAIVAKVSGQTYADFLDRHIFTPLPMYKSGSGERVRARERVAPPKQSFFGIPVSLNLVSLDLYYGAGGIISSAADMARWDMALMNGSLLSQASSHEMFSSARLPNGKLTHYGYGFVIDEHDGHPYFWHNGLAPGAGGYCLNALFPDTHIGIVILSNGSDFGLTADKMVLQIYDALGLNSNATPFIQ